MVKGAGQWADEVPHGQLDLDPIPFHLHPSPIASRPPIYAPMPRVLGSSITEGRPTFPESSPPSALLPLSCPTSQSPRARHRPHRRPKRTTHVRGKSRRLGSIGKPPGNDDRGWRMDVLGPLSHTSTYLLCVGHPSIHLEMTRFGIPGLHHLIKPCWDA